MSAAGLALSMGCGMAEPDDETREIRVVTGCRIQQEVDAAAAAAAASNTGGLVVIPAGTCMIDAPIVLPRTTLGGRGGVQLEGEGSQVTFLVASDSFPAERGLIEWAPATGDENATSRRWRAWSQRIAGMTLILQRAPGKGIWYRRTTQAHPSYEKAQFTIEDVAIESWMNWEQTAIRLEGNVHDSVIRQVELDIGIRSPAPPPAERIDGKGIVFDVGEDDGIDDDGAYNLVIDGLSTTPRSGGQQGHAVSGRVMFGTLRNIKIGRGSRGAPQIHLVASFATTVSMISEGSAESSQILVEDSRGIAIEDSLLGTPNGEIDDVTYPTGDGITFRDCDDCSVRNWAAHEDKTLWDRIGAARVRLDAASSGCDVDIMIGGGRWGDEDPLRVVVDQGRNNRVVTQNARTGEVVERYDGRRL